jgi:hypothetical protein
MSQSAREGLNEFLQQLSSMKVHRSAKDGEAKKKPLLLLLLVSRIGDGCLSLNRVRFVDVEAELGSLITRFGGRSTGSGPKPEHRTSLACSGFVTINAGRAGAGKEVSRRCAANISGSHSSLRPRIAKRFELKFRPDDLVEKRQSAELRSLPSKIRRAFDGMGENKAF